MSGRFTSTYDLKIDLKHRLFVPMDVRKQIFQENLGEAFFVTVGHNRMPWLYPDKSYEKLLAEVPLEMTPSDELLDYVHLKFALATKVAWDDSGRLVLPETVMTATGLSNDVTLAGFGDHWQIWPRAAWTARSLDLLAKSKEIESAYKKLGLNAAQKTMQTA